MALSHCVGWSGYNKVVGSRESEEVLNRGGRLEVLPSDDAKRMAVWTSPVLMVTALSRVPPYGFNAMNVLLELGWTDLIRRDEEL